MKILNTDLIFCFLLVVILNGCGNRENDNSSPALAVNPDSLKEYLNYANRALSENEEKIIDQYVIRHELKLIKTETGLRYVIYKEGSGDNARPDDHVLFNYRLQLINGIEVASSENDGPMLVAVEKGDIVSGLHELLQLMNTGAKARAIIPSRLAYGFTGDQERIPKGATLVYDIEILEIKHVN